MSICTTIFNCFFSSFVYCIFLLLAWHNIVVLFCFHIAHIKFMLVVIMYWGGCDYNRGHVPLLPVSPFSINCIALYWYIFVMLINPQLSWVELNLGVGSGGGQSSGGGLRGGAVSLPFINNKSNLSIYRKVGPTCAKKTITIWQPMLKLQSKIMSGKFFHSRCNCTFVP